MKYVRTPPFIHHSWCQCPVYYWHLISINIGVTQENTNNGNYDWFEVQ